MRPDPDRAPVEGPLPRRATDRVEDVVAWLLTGAALVVVVLAVVTGLGVHGREAERAEQQRDTVSQTRAVLLEDAHVVVSSESVHLPTQAQARWTDRDGRDHSGVVTVTRSQRAGSEVEVWIDAQGEITSRPTHPMNAVFGGIVSALGVLCAGAVPILGIWFGVRSLTLRCNARRWEREWERVEPQWRRTAF
ncbi:hypothetical protein [Pseudonocardia zijingensis]|uniref:Integral membrane protein n=1 Tax=Pseudonocardia zijingensis TaxID=153376 RepID=A0ABP3ZDK0_9PSEU